jgi:hypothetical protein
VVDDIRADARTASAARKGTVGRRTVLAGGVGASVLVALPDVLAAAPARASIASDPGSASASTATPGSVPVSGSAPGAAPAHFFLYGSPGPTSAPTLQGWRPAVRGAAPVAPHVVGSALAARPARSADGATVAFPTVSTAPSGATVTLVLVDSATAAIETSAALHLPGVPQDASVLVRPVFAPGSATVALVIAVTLPANWGTFRKVSAVGATAATTPSATWTTHHVLAYFNRVTGTFSGPFDLDDAPSLAWTDAVADSQNLYLWTIREPAVSVGTKQKPLPAPPPRLLTFPLGSGRPVRSARSSGAWPNGAAGLVLATGEVARVAEGRDLEVYSPSSGTSTRVRFAQFQQQSARAGATTLHPRPDGTLVMANAAFGRALVLDPATAFQTVSVLEYAKPKIAIGGPDAKTALSPDGTVLYTLGPASVGGLSAYDLATGDLVAAYGDGSHYAGVYQLPSGTLMAVNSTESGSQLGFFSPSLAELGAGSTDMYVAEVF